MPENLSFWRRRLAATLLLFVVTPLCTLFFSACASIAGRSLSPPICLRIAVNEPGVWVPSAAWSSDGETLVVAEIQGPRLLRFSATGVRLPDVRSVDLGPTSFVHPGQLLRTPNGFLLHDALWRWLELRADGEPLREVARLHPGLPGVSDAVFLGGELVGRGAVPEPDGSRWLGYLRLGLEPFEVRERGEQFSAGADAEWNFYSAIGRVAATAGGRAYFLRMTSPPRIEQIFPARRLSAFPSGFETLPAMAQGTTVPSRHEAYQAFMLSARLPVDLLGHGKWLYVLTREPVAEGGTRWLLHQIDPLADQAEAPLELPTRAPFLLVAPGAHHWALLEKSKIQEDGRMSLDSLLLIRSAWFENADSPLRGTAAPPPCLSGARAGGPRP